MIIEPQHDDFGNAGENGARYSWVSDPTTGLLRLDTAGAGAQAGQAVSVTFTPQQIGELLASLGRVMGAYLSPG